VRARIAAARFPVIKTIESFDFTLQAQLPKAKLLALLDGRFVSDNINPILVGPTGVGKTHVLTAIGLAAYTAGYRVLFTTAAELCMNLITAKREDRLKQRLTNYERYQLLLIDELGYVPFEKEATRWNQCSDLAEGFWRTATAASISATSRVHARKGSLKMPIRKGRPVTVSTPQKGRSKSKAGIPLDELLAAHATGRATKKTPARAPASAKAQKARPKKAPGARLARRDDVQVVQDAPPRMVGYARISTDDQTTALQADALARAAVDVVFEEEASGANTARPVLAKTLVALKSGDTLVVWRLDRLGRSLGHLIEVATVLRERGVFLRSLTEGFDTSTASGRLLYQVLGAVAEFEREVIKERTVAGMKAAKKRGTHVGRPQALVGSRLV
jgi:hypothetical protein